MRPVAWLTTGLLGISTLVQFAHATRLLESHALIPCSNNDAISVNRFDVVFTPNNQSVAADFSGSTSYTGKVMVEVQLLAYGYLVTTKTINPCDYNVAGLCPVSTTNLNFPSTSLNVPQQALSKIPEIAYQVPDLEAAVWMRFKNADTNQQIACLEARIYNGKTVYQAGVGWTLAVITGLGLIGSMILSILGYTNIATRVAFRTLLFLGFMQSQAMFGMTSVNQPPIVQSWTQNFQWTMGILHSGALQTISTWFLRSTGGTPSHLVSQVADVSVVLAKRSLSAPSLAPRSYPTTDGGSEVTLRGIERVGFRAGIAATNIFMTGYLFFYFVTVLSLVCVMLLKLILPPISKQAKSEKLDRAVSATRDWKTFLRGYLYRLSMLGYPQMCVLCLWELTHHDSAAEVILAITMWLMMSFILGWATFKVFRRAKISRSLNHDAVYALYSDPACQARWGFLYARYKAQTFYFIVPFLAYIVVKSMIIAFGQSNPVAQSIALLIFEIAYMVASIVIRPYLDRTSNGFGITAAVLNFINAVFILVFSDVFNQPPQVTQVMGVVFFIYNALFVLALLIFLLIGFYHAIKLKDPASKYERLSDNRNSFQSVHSADGNRLTSELLPLEKVAQGGHSRNTSSEGSSDSTLVQGRGDLTAPERSPFADPSGSPQTSESRNSAQTLRPGSRQSGNGNDAYRPGRFHGR